MAEKILREDIKKRKTPNFTQDQYESWSLKKSEIYLALLLATTKHPSKEINDEISSLIKEKYLGDLSIFVDILATQIRDVEIPCDLAAEHKELIEAIDTRHGSRSDMFLPKLDCSMRDEVPSLDNFFTILDISGGSYYNCTFGSITYTISKANENFLSSALIDPKNKLKINDEHSKIDYDIPLEKWSIHSLDNHIQFKKIILPAYKKTKNEIANTYKKLLNISDDDANLYAAAFLFISGERVYWDEQYKNYKETKRYKILNLAPIGDIEAAEDDLLKSSSTEMYWRDKVGEEEPILHMSVLYPEALEYLIKKNKKKEGICSKNNDCDNTTKVRYVDTATDGIGKTALMNAAKYNQIESINILLKNGANPNIQLKHPLEIKDNGYYICDLYNISYGKRTALMYATSSGSLKAIKILLDNGADKTIPDSQGLRAIQYLLGQGPLPKNNTMTDDEFKKALKLLL